MLTAATPRAANSSSAAASTRRRLRAASDRSRGTPPASSGSSGPRRGLPAADTNRTVVQSSGRNSDHGPHVRPRTGPWSGSRGAGIMSRLLHISASPRGRAAESLRIARVFTDAYAGVHPNADVEHWDLWDGSLPGFAVGARAKMTVFGGGEPVGAEAAAWAAARVAYVLKQFIDVVSRPGWVFGVDPAAGYTHLLAGRGKRVAVVYTSAVWGPALGPEFGTDFQGTYFGDWLRWVGLTDVTEIRFHPTLLGDVPAERAGTDSLARDVAKSF